MKFIAKHFSELTGEEILDIIKIRTRVFIFEQKINEDDIDEFDIDAYHMYMYSDNGEITAYCRILNPETAYKEASIGRVLVESGYRRKGLGKEIMEEAVKFVFEELGYSEIKISAQEYVEKLYETIGFKRVGEVYDEVGIPHIKMIINK